jgi:aspartyl/asparaginyl beta-hydroxylase (cupin superfamily)
MKISAQLFQSAICRTNSAYRPNPSLFYFPGLNTQPVWSNKLFPAIVEILQRKHDTLLKEYLQLVDRYPKSDYDAGHEDQHKKLHKGDWEWHSYIIKGQKKKIFSDYCPETVSLLESIQFPKLMTGTPFSFAFFSTMGGNTTIAPHSSPCNLRLRCHYPLILPKEGDLGIRIAGQIHRWKVGEPLFFDDCYEHEGNFLFNHQLETDILITSVESD